MARRSKQGFDYFPLSCDNTTEFKLVSVKIGRLKANIHFSLMQQIFKIKGYYLDYSEDIRDIIAADEGYLPEDIELFVKTAVDKGLYDRELFEKYSVITSKEIQDAYFDMSEKRSRIPVRIEYLRVNLFNLTANIFAKINLINSNGDVFSLKDIDYEAMKNDYLKKEDNPVLYLKRNVIDKDQLVISGEDIPENGGFLPENQETVTKMGIFSPEIPQSKVNKNKENESKVNFHTVEEESKVNEGKAEKSNGSAKTEACAEGITEKRTKESIKRCYGGGFNVMLTNEEYNGLKKKYPSIDDTIEELSDYLSKMHNSIDTDSHPAMLAQWAQRRCGKRKNNKISPMIEDDDELMLWGLRAMERRAAKAD